MLPTRLPSLADLETGERQEERSDNLSIPTWVHIALDRSGSMTFDRDATIEGLNRYLDALRSEGVTGFLSCTQFDTDLSERPRYAKCWDHAVIATAPRLHKEAYSPEGGTPLYDAIGRVIAELARTAPARSKVVCVIQTDGEETSSREFDRKTIRELIRLRSAEGWLFLFLGADQNAIEAGKELGIPAKNSLEYTGRASEAAFRALARLTTEYAATGGNLQLAAFTDEERKVALLGSGK